MDRASMSSFSADIDAWVKETQDRLERVFKASAQKTFHMAQVTISDGGRMRVDTGFLRLSGQASLSGIPSGPSDRKNDAMPQSDDGLVLLRAKLGDVITYGWTANYAEFRNYKDGFMTDATQKWQQTVDQVTRDAKLSAGAL